MARRYQPRINQQKSGLKLRLYPIVSVVIASALPLLLPIIATMPLLPPLGFMVLLAWRLLRPQFWPIWVGAPLGLVDDLFSGQPLGSAMLIWSVTLILLDLADQRFAFRGFRQEWVVASLFILFAIVAGYAINIAHDASIVPLALLPQIALSMVLFPLILRFTAWIDARRLRP
ncbi:rod shape-determining protein MreD [Alterisphingorhabdus coralli]|uniref:Rod shape-determining protein MreD n=1 Tax=Alterisphingorhabdus coralli TaxID=3071408 RepID=A0AA97F9J0_9SPHN|nr:rod shape-determining protein MreD [Parasphingorhabdus sp. SCSIO 66989]WOE76411.1 rod shape-determining protein MreD [Parasphingorhabdus sp. SCSIO 66989]